MDVRLFFTPEEISAIEGKIGYTFKDKTLLMTAFCHSSFAHEQGVESYERLEFLGDGVVNFVVGVEVFERFPQADEEFLTKVRSKIVRTDALAGAVDGLNVVAHVRTSKGQTGDSIKTNPHTKEDIFEALTGAILIDSGIKTAKRFVTANLKPLLEADYSRESVTDYKTAVLEYYAKQKKKVVFDCVSDGKSGFIATLTVDGQTVSEGEGTSKNRAMQSASEKHMKSVKI